jgi:MATE family multidrug resistance protein
MIFNFIYWGFSFLRMGTSGFTAQAYGGRNFREASVLLQRSSAIALLGAFLILILQIPIERFALSLIDGSKEVEYFASGYFYIRVWAAPATLRIYALSGWFIGMQNTRFPMIITIAVNVLNLGFNLFFVFVLEMKSDGVALGTVIAQYSGLLIALLLFNSYYGRFKLKIPWAEIFRKRDLNRFIRVNTDILIRTLSLVFVFSFFTAKSAAANDVVLAVNTLLLQFLMFFSYLIDGFAYAGEALIGRFTGASNKRKTRKGIQLLFMWGLTLALLFSLVYFFAGENILNLLTSNAEILSSSEPYMFWISLVPILTFPAFIWDGIYIGATASKAMRNSMLIASFLFFLPAYYLLYPHIGNHALWTALMAFMLCRGIMLSLLADKNILHPSEK